MFKKEWEGDGFIGLAAKTYYCYNLKDDGKDKYSSKGLNKTLQLERENFLNVLKNRSDFVKYTNKGFISKNKRVYTYSLTKKGLGYFYCKRKVLGNGVSTTYLDI